MKSLDTSHSSEIGLFGTAVGLWKAMRPTDWVKNVFVAAPLFFSGQATIGAKVWMTGLVVLAFCAMSSAVYLFNDIIDRENDRLHPRKQHRPIASGLLSVGAAALSTVVLACLALISISFSPSVLLLVAGYGLMNVAYSLWLKHIVIVDVFCIAIGFVLRVFGGGLAIDVPPSSWLVLATFLLSLFLALAKRRHELLTMSEKADCHRPVLEQYSIKLVDELISVVTPVTLLTYILYTLDHATMERFRSDHLYLSTPFVTFGIFRYLYLVHARDLGGSPTELVIKDIPLAMAVLGWIGAFVLIVYIS